MERVSTTFVGMDVHKASIYVAVLHVDGVKQWQIENKPQAVTKLIARLKELGDVRCCYEAGPTGFALMRTFVDAGLKCIVIAPALIPKRAGDRVKTDRRDAKKLAELLRAGLLTAVVPPTPEQEAVRGLVRARGDSRDDTTRAQHRLSKFLLCRGLSWAKKQWTQAHRKWLNSLSFELEADQMTFAAHVDALSTTEARLAALNDKVAKLAETPAYKTAVGVLGCFRGIDVLTAMVILSELGDITRFQSAPKLMGFLGITPSEHSTGGPKHRRPGAITKTGNAHVRHVVVETAWHYRAGTGARTSLTLSRRRAGQPLWAQAIADKCRERLVKTRTRLALRGKKSTVATIAVARELTGFIWAALVQLDAETKKGAA
jgi:transposase